MSIAARHINKLSLHWGHRLLLLALIASPSLAIAEQPAPTNRGQVDPTVQNSSIDPVTGLVYGSQPSVSGVAMAVDAEGHLRALCADPADSLAPSLMRDAIEPATSRLRYE